MSAMGIFSQKEKYLYNRREWWIVALIISNTIMGLVLYALMNEGDSPVPFVIVFTSLSFCFAHISSLRISITESGIKWHCGFFTKRRMFYYDEISKIVFGKIDIFNSEKPKDPDPKPWFFRPDRYAGYSSGVMCTVFLKNGEYYFVMSKHADEIMRILGKIVPELIERRLGF